MKLFFFIFWLLICNFFFLVKKKFKLSFSGIKFGVTTLFNAFSEASLHKNAISAPTYPWHLLDISSIYICFFFIFFSTNFFFKKNENEITCSGVKEWGIPCKIFVRISFLSIEFGIPERNDVFDVQNLIKNLKWIETNKKKPISISLSNRPDLLKAESREFGRFVAPITITLEFSCLFLSSIPSIRVSRVATVRFSNSLSVFYLFFVEMSKEINLFFFFQKKKNLVSFWTNCIYFINKYDTGWLGLCLFKNLT